MKLRSVKHFFDNEFTQQAQYVNFSKIASVISGNKVTAQKVMSTLLDKNVTSWQKVEVISSMTALETLYLGGSKNIDGVITNIGADYVGSNNIPLIEHKGDFGGRLDNQAAASRYIFAKRGQSFDTLLNKDDLNIFPRYNFEGQEIEYAYFAFTLPMVLVNGTDGLGSGYKSLILPRNPIKIKQYIIDYLQDNFRPTTKNSLEPYFRDFKGTIVKGEKDNQYIIKGDFKRVSKTKIEITEVPIGESYKSIIRKMNKLKDSKIIRDYIDLCDPKKDIFKISVSVDSSFSKYSDNQILNKLKLVNTVTEQLVLNDENNSIKVFDSIKDIIDYYIKFKLKTIKLRKDFILDRLETEIKFDNSKYLFIKAIIDNKLKINKRKKKDIENDLNKFDKILKKDNSYDYLLNMAIHSLTEERLLKLKETIKQKVEELRKIEKTTETEMWLEDLKGIKL